MHPKLDGSALDIVHSLTRYLTKENYICWRSRYLTVSASDPGSKGLTGRFSKFRKLNGSEAIFQNLNERDSRAGQMPIISLTFTDILLIKYQNFISLRDKRQFLCIFGQAKANIRQE